MIVYIPVLKAGFMQGAKITNVQLHVCKGTVKIMYFMQNYKAIKEFTQLRRRRQDIANNTITLILQHKRNV